MKVNQNVRCLARLSRLNCAAEICQDYSYLLLHRRPLSPPNSPSLARLTCTTVRVFCRSFASSNRSCPSLPPNITVMARRAPHSVALSHRPPPPSRGLAYVLCAHLITSLTTHTTHWHGLVSTARRGWRRYVYGREGCEGEDVLESLLAFTVTTALSVLRVDGYIHSTHLIAL